MAQIADPERSSEAIDQITEVIRAKHNLKDGQLDDFRVWDMAEMSRAMSSTTEVMTNLLMIVAMISLVVGGVGIMNIMLVSVTERTKEIGLRMAVGARPQDIMRQFLLEAVLLCVVGGRAGASRPRQGHLHHRQPHHELGHRLSPEAMALRWASPCSSAWPSDGIRPGRRPRWTPSTPCDTNNTLLLPFPCHPCSNISLSWPHAA